jgi:uncharacterized membrane protein YidH (DUF202 family)
MNLTTSLIVFAAIVISVNNFVLFYAIKNNGIHSKVHSLGMMIFLISLIEIVAIGIWGYIHLRK